MRLDLPSNPARQKLLPTYLHPFWLILVGGLSVANLACESRSHLFSDSTATIAAQPNVATTNESNTATPDSTTSRSNETKSDKLSLWTRTQGEDWPRMLGVHYDSKSSETGILTQWPKEGLKVLWSQKTGTGYGNGVAAYGRWFQFDRFENVERLSCYEAQTGNFLWKWEAPVNYRDEYGYNDGPRASPLVDEQSVYVYGVTGRLACIDIATGKERWQREMSKDYDVVPNFFGVGATPVIYDNLLIAMVGGSPKQGFLRGEPTINDLPRAKPNGSAMVALDKRTGKEVYRVGDYLASYSAPIIASLGGVDHCVALLREGLLTFQAKDGSGEAFFHGALRCSKASTLQAPSSMTIKSSSLKPTKSVAHFSNGRTNN